MFRTLAKSIRKPVLWLMVPLAVLAGRPSVGCVCADGTVHTSCCKAGWPGLDASTAKSAACCDDAQPTGCPHCCQHGSPTTDESNGCSSAGCQCQALANDVKPAKITDWSAADSFSHAPAPAVSLPTLPQVDASTMRCVRGDELHPPDRVVLYLHLTI